MTGVLRNLRYATELRTYVTTVRKQFSATKSPHRGSSSKSPQAARGHSPAPDTSWPAHQSAMHAARPPGPTGAAACAQLAVAAGKGQLLANHDVATSFLRTQPRVPYSPSRGNAFPDGEQTATTGPYGPRRRLVFEAPQVRGLPRTSHLPITAKGRTDCIRQTTPLDPR